MSSEARGLVRAVRGRADLNTDEQAARAVAATLTTLAERVAGGLPAEVLAKVPDDLRSKLRRDSEGGLEDRDVFDIKEFFRRVGEREAIDLQAAVDHALAVTEALCEEVSASTLAGLRVRLPDEFQRLFVGATGGRGAPRP